MQVEDLSKRLRHKALLVHELQGELVTRASHEKEVLAARGVLQQVKDNCAEAVRLAHVDAERSASHALATAQSDAERTRGKMEASLARAHRLLLQKTEAEEAVRQEKEEAELRYCCWTCCHLPAFLCLVTCFLSLVLSLLLFSWHELRLSDLRFPVIYPIHTVTSIPRCVLFPSDWPLRPGTWLQSGSSWRRPAKACF